MTQENQTYKCSICGNIVKVIRAGTGELHCCGLPMKLVDKEDLKKDK